VRHGHCTNGTLSRDAEECLAAGDVGWTGVFLGNYLPRANTAGIHNTYVALGAVRSRQSCRSGP
jgi:hypothetical protein